MESMGNMLERQSGHLRRKSYGSISDTASSTGAGEGPGEKHRADSVGELISVDRYHVKHAESMDHTEFSEHSVATAWLRL